MNQLANMVHLGLGSFHRSHQAWYTHKLNQAGPQWGYHSFSGNSRDLVDRLNKQNGKYSLVETESGSNPVVTTVESIKKCGVSSDSVVFQNAVADEKTVCVTLTISEAGYSATKNDGAIQRLSAALYKRFKLSAAPLSVISCDNLPNNGDTTRASVLEASEVYDSDFRDWISSNLSFPNTMVDRITPNPKDDLADLVELSTGFQDLAPVLTESFSEWFIEGSPNKTLPAWEQVGAKYVEDISPYENRKLWLLNGAHSLMAYMGKLHNLENVRDAMNDSKVSNSVEELWSEVSSILPAEGLEDYISQLRLRFDNPHIDHSLAKISQNGPSKLTTRCLPVMKKRAKKLGAHSPALAMTVASWIIYLAGNSASGLDLESKRLMEHYEEDKTSTIRDLVRDLDYESSDNEIVMDSIIEAHQMLIRERV